MKILLLSDAHLRGDDDPTQSRLLALLDMIKGRCDTVILLGDIFEFWFEYSTIYRGYRPVVARFTELAVDYGVRFIYLSGNHDFEIEKTFGAIPNFTVADKFFVVELNGKRAYLSHGDTIDTGDRGYLFLRGMLRSRFFRILKALVPSSVAFWLAGFFSKASRAIKNHQNIRLAGIMREWAQRMLSEGEYDIVALGHSHVADLVEMEKGRAYVNTGGFLGDGKFALIDEGGRVTLHTEIPEDPHV